MSNRYPAPVPEESRHAGMASLEMAFVMSVGMAVWMRRRRHGWASTLEMCA
ncbi:hypothetical protein J7F01_11945 [Streptomyces sp. ISL-22]|uniref:hypothetical protein n=1 Tax=unclassified Streptomyces TaxID=2593676 RepID=UPI001BE677AA|nr:MULTISPECIES: hypothetical protein [unclassified Streptomyces]MBT2422032.1 hypothetical protein [Streptomyces sp. ISL-24]MBT2432892.1 hypothetical protein [Streptomyces sp. ISL-22]